MPALTRRRFLLGLSAACCAAGGLFARRTTSGQQTPPQPPSTPLYPIDVCTDSAGQLYVSDSRLHAVWILTQDGYKLLYRGSDRYRTPLYRAWDIAPLGEDGFVVSDPGTMDVWLLRKDGSIKPFTARLIRPEEDKQLPVREQRFAGLFDKPMALAVADDGTVYVADLGLNGVYRLSKPGTEPEQIGTVPAPRGIVIDRDGSLVIVSHGKQQLVRLSADGKLSPIVDGFIAPSDVVSFPHQVVLWGEDGYLVSDGYARTLWHIDAKGNVKPLVQGDPLRNPVGLWRSPDGTVYLADPHARKIYRVESDGKLQIAGA